MVKRSQLIEVLRNTHLPDLADEAELTLPEELEMEAAVAWCLRHGLTRDQLVSLMGGSP
jgi:hypothetical protein